MTIERFEIRKAASIGAFWGPLLGPIATWYGEDNEPGALADAGRIAGNYPNEYVLVTAFREEAVPFTRLLIYPRDQAAGGGIYPDRT